MEPQGIPWKNYPKGGVLLGLECLVLIKDLRGPRQKHYDAVSLQPNILTKGMIENTLDSMNLSGSRCFQLNSKFVNNMSLNGNRQWGVAHIIELGNTNAGQGKPVLFWMKRTTLFELVNRLTLDADVDNQTSPRLLLTE
ncbi:hypothetical protein Tco_0321243 [Tanacetum coccineum]